MEGKKLKELRKSKGWTQAKLAKYLNVDTSAIGKWEIYNITPSIDTLKKICELFNVNVSYLLGINSSNLKPINLERTVTKIPVYGTIPAGIPVEAIEEILDYEEIPESFASSGVFFALKVKGNSMFPEIKNNDIVIIRKQEDAENGDICAVMVNGYDATLKTIKKDISGITLIPRNPEYETKTYTPAEVEQLPVRIIGKVIEIRRML